MKIKSLWISALCMLLAASAYGYEIIEVEDGGSLKGQITYKGKAAAGTLEVTKDQTVCHATVPDESLVVGEGNGLANVIVYFVEVAEGKDPASLPTPVLKNLECRYVPHTLAMMVGQKLEITNEDPILHNTHTYDEAEKTVFNYPFPTQGSKKAKRMKKVGLVNAKCDAGHTWMNSYVYVNQNPYYAVTDDKGMFEITEIPEGDYTVVTWHEKLGTQEHEISVNAGEAAELAVTMAE